MVKLHCIFFINHVFPGFLRCFFFALCISKVSICLSASLVWLHAVCLRAFPLICPPLSRWILRTWRNIWCIWSSRIRVRCTIWTCCGATTRRTATLARQLMYWPVSLTCTGLDPEQLDNKFYSGRLLLLYLTYLQKRLLWTGSNTFPSANSCLPLFLFCCCRLIWSCSTEISLKQRLEYIARAILSAKSSSCISAQASDGEFLHELEEKMEVCMWWWLIALIVLLWNLMLLPLSFCVLFSFLAGAHPSTDSGDPDQTVLPLSLSEKCHLSVGLWAHGHHQGNTSRTVVIRSL